MTPTSDLSGQLTDDICNVRRGLLHHTMKSDPVVSINTCMDVTMTSVMVATPGGWSHALDG